MRTERTERLRTLNLGVLAHVDAGKTTLTERLLHVAGAIDAIGSVDRGTTQTDSMALERQRGITIRAAVVTFTLDGMTINLIDTPGHPDFIAEVDRSLRVLDGAVLVVSAVEGVQAQTVVLMRALQRLRVPTLVFVNKIDRTGADPGRAVAAIDERLTPHAIVLGSVQGAGRRSAAVLPLDRDDRDLLDAMVEHLVDHDEALLAAVVDDRRPVPDDLWAAVATQTAAAQVHPVLFGSAVTGAGVAELVGAVTSLLPAAGDDADGPVSGSVFKVDRATSGEKVAYVRMFSGTVRRRDRLDLGRGDSATVTAVRVYEHGAAVERPAVRAGEIAQLSGLAGVQVGDTIGTADGRPAGGVFAPPTLETAVVARDPAQKAALHTGLTELAELDPLIDLRQDDLRQELFVSLYGEVQKEIIEQTLLADFGVAVEFRETSTICVERPIGSGEAIERMGKRGNPFLGTIGLRVEPAPVGSGVSLRVEADVTSIPLYVYKTMEAFRDAMEGYVRATFEQGLSGWAVTDCLVTMTESDYTSPSTTSGDFRKLTPLVVMAALRQAGTVVCEPIHRFHLEAPADSLAALLGLLAQARAAPEGPVLSGSWCTLDGAVPAAEVHGVHRQLPRHHPRRGRVRGHLRPVRARGRSRADPPAVGQQPTRPQGVPAARPRPPLTASPPTPILRRFRLPGRPLSTQKRRGARPARRMRGAWRSADRRRPAGS